MSTLERLLEGVAKAQKRYAIPIFIYVIIVTGFLAVGLRGIKLQTDLTKEMPQHLPIFRLNDRISDTFGGQDTVILLFQLDDSLDTKEAIDDIRHPYVMQSIIALENVLSKESAVDSVTSVAGYLRGHPFYTAEHVKAILDSKPASAAFFSRDYASTLMYIKADVGSSEEKIVKLSNLIREDVESVPGIPGVKVSITGNPPMRVVILSLLGRRSLHPEPCSINYSDSAMRYGKVIYKGPARLHSAAPGPDMDHGYNGVAEDTIVSCNRGAGSHDPRPGSRVRSVHAHTVQGGA